MRLVTYERAGQPRLGLLVHDRVVDAAEAAAKASARPDSLPDSMQGFVEAGQPALDGAQALIAALAGDATALAASSIPFSDARLLAPIPRPARNIVCVGLNYAEHAAESRMSQGLPEYPVFFTKPPSTVVGQEAIVPLHASVSRRVDWEVELAVIIGRGGVDISEAEALEYVFGYTVGNDVTARDLQNRHQQWYKGKGLDGFCPLGPCIVTRDELPDPQRVRIGLTVNGESKQDADTGDMVFSVAKLISVLSAGMTLEPGDILMTGTPSGVGFARKPPEYLQAGDVMEARVDGIGVLRNTMGQK